MYKFKIFIHQEKISNTAHRIDSLCSFASVTFKRSSLVYYLSSFMLSFIFICFIMVRQLRSRSALLACIYKTLMIWHRRVHWTYVKIPHKKIVWARTLNLILSFNYLKRYLKISNNICNQKSRIKYSAFRCHNFDDTLLKRFGTLDTRARFLKTF